MQYYWIKLGFIYFLILVLIITLIFPFLDSFISFILPTKLKIKLIYHYFVRLLTSPLICFKCITRFIAILQIRLSLKPKIFIWIGADLTAYCTSYFLQKIFDAEFYAIIDITNRPKKFFQEQALLIRCIHVLDSKEFPFLKLL